MSGPDERPFFFDLGSERLFGFMHLAHEGGDTGIVFCHALAEEKLWSHRVYVNFARDMAATGYSVLRFDMRGEGDSDVSFEDTTVSSRVQDTLRAVETLAENAKGIDNIVLVGHRLGGSIAARAALTATRPACVRALVAWDPIFDGEECFLQLLRSHLATQMATEGKVSRTREDLLRSLLRGETVTVDGYALNSRLYREMKALTAESTFGSLTLPALILSQRQNDAALDALVEANPWIRAATASEPPFWRETRQFHQRAPELTRMTLEWITDLKDHKWKSSP